MELQAPAQQHYLAAFALCCHLRCIQTLASDFSHLHRRLKKQASKIFIGFA